MSRPRVRSFFRVATAFPPPDADYLTARERGRTPAPDASEQERRSYDGLSAFDTEKAARRIARRFKRLGTLIVRYGIPEGAGIAWEQSGGDPHHYDLFGDREELKRYLSDTVAKVWARPGTSARSTTMYDLWDVEIKKYLGRFETEAEALARVRWLLEANGEDYAADLELGAVEDEFGERNLTGEALTQRARAAAVDAPLATPVRP